jgi:hypothetical protein
MKTLFVLTRRYTDERENGAIKSRKATLDELERYNWITPNGGWHITNGFARAIERKFKSKKYRSTPDYA